MKAVAGTIKRLRDGILRFIRSRITTGKPEGINRRIKAAARRTFGFKSFEYYRTIIYLIAAKLALPVSA
ncbi:MAG: transposase [Candidatus Sericytochromatia bacterium]|nr:transposase [Candidatus Sericytochromatia bacterium]